MQSKVYKTAFAALIGLLALGTASAQTAAPGAPPAAQPSIVTPVTPSPGQYAYTPVPSFNYNRANIYIVDGDSVYRNKMRRLQDKMRALSKEMSDLSKEESKKVTEETRQRIMVLRKKDELHFDSVMNKNFNHTFTYRFDNNLAAANLEKQVQNGEVKEKSKTFSKSYSLDNNDVIQIDNNYGKVNVNTWNKKEVKVDVDIKAYANEDDEAQKLLDQTTINSSKDGNVVAFKTDINQGRNSWWGTMSQNGKITKVRKVVINYTVYMPAKAALTLNNKYGAVSLPDLDGKLNIKTSYGGLVAKTLSNTDNVISVNYGDANIGSVTGSQVNVAYGSLALDVADNLNATVKYSPVKIGKLNSSGVIDLKYGGGLVINDLGKSLKTLSINSSYAPVKLTSVSNTNADFDVTTHYGDFFYDNTTSVTSKTPENQRGFTSTKNYKGHVGKGSADKVITIKSNYSNIKFD